MKFLSDNSVDLSHLIDNQFPQFVREDNSTFIKFIKAYYESQELKNSPFDIAQNLIEYYNIGFYKKSELVENTNLNGNIANSATTINVDSTVGFPDKGYIQIDDEIVYYGSKTTTSFTSCVRGTSALILTNIPLSQVSLKTSLAETHLDNAVVTNVAYEFTSEFFRRIRSEIAVTIPENLVSELDLSSFFSRIRSFYGAKGSLNSHAILFRILFNDKKIKFTTKTRGSGATLKIPNFDGAITGLEITSGGSGYDSRTDGSSLINPPIIEVFGSGTGINVANPTALLTVNSITSGVIDGVTITDAGENYVGPITAFVRERDFAEEELVTSIAGTGSGVVESWDYNTGELTLTNIIGFFVNADELQSGSGEGARVFVKTFEIISQDPEIEFPKDYLFRPSNSNYGGKKLARLEIVKKLSNISDPSLDVISNNKTLAPSYITFLQDQDTIFGVSNVNIESSQVIKIDDVGKPTYEADIEINDDFNKIYLPASTQLVKAFDPSSDTIITVDDASGFPTTKGQVYIDDVIIDYDERSVNQFLGCTVVSGSGIKAVSTEVVAYGRYRTRKQYTRGEFVGLDQERYYGENLYRSKNEGISSSTADPTHSLGSIKVGDIEWEYIGSSKVTYFVDVFVGFPEISCTGNEGELTIRVDKVRDIAVGQSVVGSGIGVGAKIRSISGKELTLSIPNTSKVTGGCIFSVAQARLMGLVDNITIEKSGALFSPQKYFLDDKTYEDFSGTEYSAWNVNSDHTLDTDNDFVGISQLYNYKSPKDEHVYVSSSAIPGYIFSGSVNAKNRVLSNIFDGYTNAFTLIGLTNPIEKDLFIFRNALLQDPSTDFDVVNDILTFVETPSQNEPVYVRYFNDTNKVTKLTYTQTTQGASSSTITLSGLGSFNTSNDYLFVTVNGVLQVGNAISYNNTSKVATFTDNVNTLTTTLTATGATYAPSNGNLTLTILNSNLTVGDKIKIADGGITFTCAKDGDTTTHPYPRSTDPASDEWLEITSISGNDHVVNVGISSDTSTHTFVSAVTNSITRRPDKVVAYWIKNAKVLDAITSSSSSTYTLQQSSSNYTAATTDTVFVAINGVIQKPTTSYTISGSTLTFSEVNSGTAITVIDLEDGSGGADIINVNLGSLAGINQDKDNYKLQKLVKRIPFPASLINNNVLRTSKALSPTSSLKGIGITVDGIQFNSIQGNKVQYGAVKSITIGSGGNYEVPLDKTTTGSGKFLKSSYPKVILTKNGGETSDVTISESIFDMSAGIKSIDINKFLDITPLTGFTIKPNVEVVSSTTVATGFRKAVVDVSYKNGTIDGFIVVDSGSGYTEAPTIKITGGGKLESENFSIPFFNTSTNDLIVTMEGSIISSKSASSTITLTTPVGSKFNVNPVTTVDSGSNGLVKVFVANGQIVATQVLDKGQNYFTEPTIKIVGVGTNGVLRARLDGSGGINGVDIINAGSGYTVPPVITVINDDTLAVANSTLNQWTFNIPNRFNTKIDEFGGYVFDSNSGVILKVASFTTSTLVLSEAPTGVVVGMEVTHPQIPIGTFVTKIDTSGKIIYLSRSGLDQVTNISLNGSLVSFYQGDDRFRGTLKAQEVISTNFAESRLNFQYLQLKNTTKFETYYNISSSAHSKLVGFSYDGHPIYCKYGYSTPLDNTSAIEEQTSSWRLKGNRFNGPLVADYPLGSFIEDYEYDKTYGTLDEFNGRFCVTPEYPDGAYCYFMVDVFPFLIGPKYFSDPDCYNTGNNRSNDQIPKHFIRVNDTANQYFPQEEKNINKSILFTDYSSVGTVDNMFIESAGDNYKVGDNIVFDDDETGGSGAIAYVSSVDSPPISDIQIGSDGVIEFTFTGTHQISENDVIDVTYTKQTTNTVINLDTISSVPTQLSGKNLYNVILESHKIYRLEFGTTRPYNLSFDILNFNPYFQRDIDLKPTYVDIDPTKIPSVIFIHTSQSIFELRVESAPIIGRHLVTEVLSPNTFTVKDISVKTADTSVIDIAIKSNGASGPIKTINVVNGGSGYRVLPGIKSITSTSGKGGLLQATSTTIGSINSVKFITYGDKFYGSKTVRNYVDLPITIKVKSNFEIESVKVLTNGKNYLVNPYVRVNGLNDAATLQPSFSTGEVVSMDVVDGGSGFSTEPTIQVFSQNGGSGATFSSTLRRKSLTVGDTLSIQGKSSSAKILSVDTRASTVELLVSSGTFLKDDVLILSDGKTYGTIIEVNTAKAYAKSNSFGQIKEKFIGSAGFISDSFQKLGDNTYYQDWSYSLSNDRNIVDWKRNINDNTHPAGFKFFGKNRLHSRKSILGRSQDIVRSAVTFKSSISSLLNSNLEVPFEGKCTKSYIYFHNLASPNPYKVNDIVFGSITGNLGFVIEVGVGYIVVEYQNGEIQIGENVINYLRNVTLTSTSETSKALVAVNGILQSPGTSYDVSANQLLPKFPIFPGDEIVGHYLTTKFEIIEGIGINNGNEINLSQGGLDYTASSSDHLLVSLDGVIQKSSNMTLANGGKAIKFAGSNLAADTKIQFVLEHSQLQPLTFTGSAGTAFTLNVTPSSNCKLLVFFVGVDQSHLLTDYTVSGNTITFASSVNPDEIFGWHINETVTCEKVALPNLYSNPASGVDKVCNQANNITLEINSDNVKRANDFYEIQKEQLDGTMFLSGSQVYGFDTKFKTSNPENSTSHVEVINDISDKTNNVTSTFDLKINKNQSYTPVDGINSLQVTVNGTILGKNNRTVTPTTASYVASTGVMTLTVPNHQFDTGDFVKIADNAITFTCTMDSNATNHSYPRSTDPFSGEWIAVTKVDNNNFSVNVGKSPTKKFTATAASYATGSGQLTLTIGGHTLKTGTKVKIATDSIKFNVGGSVITYPSAAGGTTYASILSVTGTTIVLDFGVPNNTATHVFLSGSADLVRNSITTGGDYTHTFVSATVGGIKSATGYTVSGTQITFIKPPLLNDKISIKDFVSTYKANSGTKKGAEVDEFNSANGVRKIFNISDDGIPETVSNKTDLFTIKNGILIKPDIHLGGTDSRDNTQHISAVGNKITFNVAPAATDKIGTMVFNRQLLPANKRNWVLDRNEEFDGTRKLFTLQLSKDDHTKNWVDLIGVPTAESIIVVKNDKTLAPTTDYTIVTPTDPNDINDGAGSYRLNFVVAPTSTDIIHVMYTANDANFEDRTGELSQTSAKVLSYTSALSGTGWIPFCYVDGDYIDQTDVTHDQTAKTLTFTNNTTLASQKVEVHFKKATLNTTNVYGDITTAELIVKQRNNNNVEIATTNNTYNLLLRNGSSNSTITGVKVVNILLRDGSTPLIIGSDHYRILTMNLNNPAMFDAAGATFVAANGIVLAPDDHYDHSGSGTPATTGIGDGKTYAAIQFKFYGYMNKGLGAEWHLSDPRGMPYLAKIDILTHDKDDGDGRLRRVNMINQKTGSFGGNNRTAFRLEVDGVRYTNYVADEDILVFKNDIPLKPNTDYNLSGVTDTATSEKGDIVFASAPSSSDTFYMVAMQSNELLSITMTNSTTGSLSRQLTAAEREGLIIIAENKLHFGNGQGFVMNSNNQTIVFDTAPGSGLHTPFAISTNTGKIADKINTPFDGTEPAFNLFLDSENFVPVGQYGNDAAPDVNSLFVTKNGSLLIPTTDYTIGGNIGSKIVFNVSPSVGDDITISTQGVMRPLDNISSTTGKEHTLKLSSADYYPNAVIGRPRELENQIVAIKNNKLLDPIKDYYVLNQKIVFTEALINSDVIRLLDWYGDHDDFAVSSYNQQVEVNETIQLPGESLRRTVTAVHSPTAITVNSPTGITSPSGINARPDVVDGKLSAITVANGGVGYPQNTKFRTYGLGDSASANTILVPTKGNSVKTITGSGTDTVTNAAYVPSTGVLTLTIPHHGLSTGDNIKLADESLTFRCSMDNYATEHKYPRNTTITHTASNASYIPSTGTLTITTSKPHNLQTGDRIKIGDNSLTFKCALDSYQTTHTYPRSTDPFSDKWLPVSNITNTTFTVNVGSSTLTTYTPTAVDYEPSTGDMTLNIGSHNISIGDPIRIADGSLTFTCTLDGNIAEKSYPRSNATYHSITNAVYDPTSGIMTVTLNNHGFIKGEYVKFLVNSLQFTCTTDGNTIPKTYPRPTDPAYDTWLKIDNITTNTFTVQVLDTVPSTNTAAHTFVGASVNGLAKKVDQAYQTALSVIKRTTDTITVNVLAKIPSTNLSVHTFVKAATGAISSGGGYLHRFVSAAADSISEKRDFASEQFLQSTVVDEDTLTVNVGIVLPNTQYTPTTGTSYDPASGLLVLNLGADYNELKVGKSVIITDNALKFKCAMDNNDSIKSYPRPGLDKASERSLKITAKSGNTITVDVGVAGTNKTFTPSMAHYNQITGDMVIFIGQHGLRKDANVVLVNNSLTFQCAKDNYVSLHTYPRAGTDPYANEKSIAITNVGSTEHTVTSASYVSSTGIVTISVLDPSNKFANDDYILVNDNALVFTCNLDGNATQHPYPRAGYDLPSNKWLKISSKTHNSGTSTFNINVGSSTYTGTHTFVGAAVDALQRQNGEITINVGFDSDAGDQYEHRFVSATTGAVKYTPNSTHTFQSADANSVKMLGDATHKFVRSTTNGVSVEAKTFVSVGDTVIDYVGHNLSNTTLVPTYESYVVRDEQLNSSDVTFGTKLSSGINTSVETIPVTGTGMASESNIGITITSGSGSSAVLQPFVVDGKITKVVVETAGSGYDSNDIVLTVTNGGGSGAVLEPVLNGSGAFTSVTVTNEGIGYDSYKAFINKEVIEYTNHTTTNLKGVTRGIAGSTAATGAQNDKVYFDS
tara:strand:- start:16997 stop:31330 length:14334 start_codon:yes stop_codon:yes gene_type:complete